MNRFMTPAEGLVLAVAAVLSVVVFVQGRRGAIGPGVGLALLTLVVLATAAAHLHMVAR